jgi:hypothetical protein
LVELGGKYDYLASLHTFEIYKAGIAEQKVGRMAGWLRRQLLKHNQAQQHRNFIAIPSFGPTLVPVQLRQAVQSSAPCYIGGPVQGV